MFKLDTLRNNTQKFLNGKIIIHKCESGELIAFFIYYQLRYFAKGKYTIITSYSERKDLTHYLIA